MIFVDVFTFLHANRNRVDFLPLSDDVMKLNRYLKEEGESAKWMCEDGAMLVKWHEHDVEEPPVYRLDGAGLCWPL